MKRRGLPRLFFLQKNEIFTLIKKNIFLHANFMQLKIQKYY